MYSRPKVGLIGEVHLVISCQLLELGPLGETAVLDLAVCLEVLE